MFTFTLVGAMTVEAQVNSQNLKSTSEQSAAKKLVAMDNQDSIEQINSELV